MYNKLFTKILDSSIWMEPSSTRIVWLTLIAAMDETGFAQFAGIPNLAHRAIVSPDDTAEAVKALESPDPDSSDPENEGRRIERVPGGWMVLNAQKYREIVTRVASREQTRLRVARHRAKLKDDATNGNANVTPSTEVSRTCNPPVMQSETDTETDTETQEVLPSRKTRKARSAEKKSPKPVDAEFLSEMGTRFPALNIADCFSDCVDWWARMKNREPNRQALRNWLTKEEEKREQRTNGKSKSNSEEKPFEFEAAARIGC